MPINPSIALGVKPVDLPDPLAAYGKFAVIQQGQVQNQLHQMQMEKLRREQNALAATNEAYAKSINPETGSVDQNMLVQNLAQMGQASQIPSALTAQSQLAEQQAKREKEQLAVTAARMTQARDALTVVTTPGQYAQWRVNTISQLPGLANMIPLDYTPDTVRRLMVGADKWLAESKPTLVSTETGGGVQLGTRDPFTGEYKPGTVVSKTPLPTGVAEQKAQIAKAGAPSITVSTEKKYGEKFAGNVADIDTAKMTAAEKAPDLADSANRIIGLVQQGNLFTGAAADIKLALARALNVVGASNEESIANTEKLIAATGKSTLDAIKGAGLGTGQGFTDKDLRFLQGVAGGTINLTSQTLTELATLQHRVATRSAEAWNKRIKQIPADVLTGMGMPTEPITVPPLAPVKKPTGSRPAGVGADWSMMTDANGNRAWVSPDRKSFVEVK